MVLLDREQVRALEYDKGQRWFEDEPEPRSGMDDVDHGVMDRYKRAIGAADIPDERVLRSRGFLVDGRLTNAGVLLFARYPAAFLPSARVRVIRVDGTELHTGRGLSVVNRTEIPAEGLTPTERKALTLAVDNGKVTTKVLAEAAEVSARTASKTLKELAGKGILNWCGSGTRDPKQYYTYS
ncbi:MarR family transcriptional regulator [Bifidobacterium aesculapii]|uniref:MarR family transcriptional regulator n=1 Tax=Bifidobacterium aesculapii TaxID=1329411 RepID=UPI0006E14D52|nr:MarR family transcriptional regulator [Bifidobacterium aesculapii]